MGNMEAQQAAMKEKLSKISVAGEAGEGAIKVTCNGLREVLNININKEKLNWDDSEEIEDLLTVAVNRAITAAAEIEAAEAQNSIKDMLPPGMGGLSGLFG